MFSRVLLFLYSGDFAHDRNQSTILASLACFHHRTFSNLRDNFVTVPDVPVRKSFVLLPQQEIAVREYLEENWTACVSYCTLPNQLHPARIYAGLRDSLKLSGLQWRQDKTTHQDDPLQDTGSAHNLHGRHLYHRGIQQQPGVAHQHHPYISRHLHPVIFHLFVH